MTGIEACVFDAYGTLFDVHSAVARLRERVGEQADALSQLWRTKQLEYTWLRSLMGRHVDFWQVTGDALDHALARTGVDPGVREPLLRRCRSGATVDGTTSVRDSALTSWRPPSAIPRPLSAGSTQ
jgi:2-haloalkanoic acid dehalogenase type II